MIWPSRRKLRRTDICVPARAVSGDGGIQQARSATNKNKDAKTTIQLANARANLNVILADGSTGVHNSRVSKTGKVSPQGAVGDCLRLANLWVELACRTSGANCTGTPYNPISGPITEPNLAICLAH